MWEAGDMYGAEIHPHGPRRELAGSADRRPELQMAAQGDRRKPGRPKHPPTESPPQLCSPGIMLHCRQCDEQAWAGSVRLAETFGWTEIVQLKDQDYTGLCIDCSPDIYESPPSPT